MPFRWLRHCARVSVDRPVISATSSARSSRPVPSRAATDFDGDCTSLGAVAMPKPVPHLRNWTFLCTSERTLPDRRAALVRRAIPLPAASAHNAFLSGQRWVSRDLLLMFSLQASMPPEQTEETAMIEAQTSPSRRLLPNCPFTP